MLEARVAQPVTEAEAVRLARELYGLEAMARALPGEYDDNFHLTSADGQEFVLKVMYPARERSFIDLQCRALTHLAQRAPQLSLPRVTPNRSGELFTSIVAADGSTRLVWLLTYLKGRVLAEVRPRTTELLGALGRFLGEMDAALQSFAHPAARRELKWDASRAVWIRDYIRQIGDSKRRALVEKFLALYEAEVVPVLPRLRRSVIYGDANDYNVLISDAWPQPRKIAGLIDFGDMHHGITVSEAAIAAAYGVLGKEAPLQAAAAIVAGYHSTFPLDEMEVSVLFALIGARLAVSVTNSAQRKTVKPGDPYVTVSEEPAWEALERLEKIHPRFAHYTFRAACGLPAVPTSEKIKQWLEACSSSAASLLDVDLRTAPSVVFDLSVGDTFLGARPGVANNPEVRERFSAAMKQAGAAFAVGRYDEPRLVYASPLFGASGNPTDERRTMHLGMDLFVEPGTRLRAPLDGVVHIAANNSAPLDYGPLVILQHEAGDGEKFFILYGHLTKETLLKLKAGQRVVRGEEFAQVGATEENGGWTPHVHFQIILDLLELGADFPGVAYASQRAVWTSLSPDPNLLLGIPAERFPTTEPAVSETLAARRSFLGKNLSIYQRPLKIVRGWMQYLYDETGRAYLDVYNNVPLVGHSHPRVVQAAQAQLALLNTNTRYLHDNVNRYAERLTRLLPEPLHVCFFVNSGSEANELALRMARAHTGREDIIVLEHAYHGHTNTLIDISPYKFDGPGGRGKKPWVHVAPLADDYRGAYRRGDKQAGAKYARHVGEILERARGEGRGIAAYIAETLPSVGGQIVFPPRYLAEVYQHVAEIANSFNNGMEFFSTFGGNPVACAAGLAVLDVLEEEKLQQHALRVGAYFIEGLKSLQARYALIGDVRGSGLFLGIDLVLDRETREAAPLQASYLVNRLRDCGILAGTDGPHHNVIKLRPPLVFSEADADLFVKTLDALLRDDAAKPSR